MYLVVWSGRRVAGFAILRLVGFPVVMAAFVVMAAWSSTSMVGYHPWLLPPALLVAAWAWSRRSRPEPD